MNKSYLYIIQKSIISTSKCTKQVNICLLTSIILRLSQSSFMLR